MQYSIDAQALQAIFNYLIQQPYKDVAGFVQSIQEAKQIVDKEVVDDNKG